MIQENPIIFREIQKFRQIWLYVLLISYSVTLFVGIIRKIFWHIPFGGNFMPLWILILLWLIFGLACPILLFKANLITEVREDGLYIKLFPFHLSFHKISLEDLKSVKARTYNPIKEFGGWGIRYGAYCNAYNVSGNKGVELEFSAQKNLLIGSQKAPELAKALQGFIKQQSI